MSVASSLLSGCEMFKVKSLRSVINLRVILSVFIIILMGGSLAIWQAKHSVEREVQASFNLAVEMIKTGIEQNHQTDNKSYLHHIFSALQHARHININLIDDNGQQTALIQEVNKESLSTVPAWYNYLVNTKQLQTEFFITMDNGLLQRIEVTSDPNDEITEAWNESQSYLWSIIVMMLIIFITINLVFQTVLRSVSSILSGLRQVESGQYEHVLPTSNIREFDAIASEVNSLSHILADTRNKNRALARHTMQIQEQERQTMSRELHDEMGQSLTAIKAMSVAAKQPETDVKVIADSIIEICDHLSGVARSMMRTLHPLSLSELGLGATLKELIDEWQRRHVGIDITLDYDEQLDHINDEISIHVYRIVQECLTNIVRHAKANKVQVSLQKSNKRARPYLEISVQDNGIGGSSEGNGFGVRSMRERVESMQGTFSFEPSQGQGITVNASIPFITESELNE